MRGVLATGIPAGDARLLMVQGTESARTALALPHADGPRSIWTQAKLAGTPGGSTVALEPDAGSAVRIQALTVF